MASMGLIRDARIAGKNPPKSPIAVAKPPNTAQRPPRKAPSMPKARMAGKIEKGRMLRAWIMKTALIKQARTVP